LNSDFWNIGARGSIIKKRPEQVKREFRMMNDPERPQAVSTRPAEAVWVEAVARGTHALESTAPLKPDDSPPERTRVLAAH
jgi:hypothetical protein